MPMYFPGRNESGHNPITPAVIRAPSYLDGDFNFLADFLVTQNGKH